MTNVFWFKDGVPFSPQEPINPEHVPDSDVKFKLLDALSHAEQIEHLVIVVRFINELPFVWATEMHPDTMAGMAVDFFNHQNNESYNTTLEYLADLEGTDDEIDS